MCEALCHVNIVLRRGEEFDVVRKGVEVSLTDSSWCHRDTEQE